MGSYNGVSVFSFVCLLLGTAAVITSIVTQHWSTHTTNIFGAAQVGYHRGLLQSCKVGGSAAFEFETVSCENRYEALYKELKENVNDLTARGDTSGFLGTKNVEMWEFAILLMMGASAVFGVLALLVGPCCCHRCGCCLGSYVLFAALCSAAGVLTYVYYTEKGASAKVFGIEVNTETAGNYGYSFYVAVAGAVLQALAAIMFCVGGRGGNSHQYTQHI